MGVLVLMLVSAARATDRRFELQYDVIVDGLTAGKVAEIWVPAPKSGPAQDVEMVGQLVPENGRIAEEPRFHNRMMFCKSSVDADGRIHIAMRYHVVRREITAEPADLHVDDSQFLQRDARVPIGGRALAWVIGRAIPDEPLAAAKLFYDVIDDHMVYAKDRPGWGNGDSDWACQSRRGNCTDFHSLFLSLARAYHIPARFEIGFRLPAEKGSGNLSGYHCWAMFKASPAQWTPIDVADANLHPALREYYFGHLPPDRVTFSTGRDIELVPRQSSPPLNYFIYPHVEVDGTAIDAKQIHCSFTFRDDH